MIGNADWHERTWHCCCSAGRNVPVMQQCFIEKRKRSNKTLNPNHSTLFLGMKLYADDSSLHQHDRCWCHSCSCKADCMSCQADVDALLSTSRLRLKLTKTHVICLGSKRQLAKIDVANVPVLSSTIWIQEAAGDLGVVIDSRLSLCDHARGCCLLERLLPQATNATSRPLLVGGCHKDGPRIHYYSRLDSGNAL